MITIVTDTSAGYSKKEASSRNVKVVELNYSISSINYTETFRGENGNFYNAFKGKLLKTSQPSPQSFKNIFSECVNNGGEVLCITLSSTLSGTYSSASLAAKEFAGKVKVVDSGTTSSGLHMLVDEAVNMVVGCMSLKEICDGLEQIKSKISMVFTVETLEPLRRGGRLVINQAPNTTLNSRPILECDSGIKFITNVRGIKSRISALVDSIPKSARRIFVMKSGEDTDTSGLISAIAAKFPNIKIHLRVIGPVLTVHIGEGAFGVAYISK